MGVKYVHSFADLLYVRPMLDAYILTLMVAKLCAHCFFATTYTAEQRCCECDEISAIYRHCFEIYRWVRMYGALVSRSFWHITRLRVEFPIEPFET